MQLKKLNNVTIVFLSLIAGLSLVGSFTADDFQQASEKVNDTRWRSLMYADQLLDGSKFLTNAVRAFAATGDAKYQQAYDQEVNLSRSRDKALEALVALGTPQSELALVEQAKSMSDILIDLEKRAFAAGNQGDLQLAVELVYGSEYQQALQSIYNPINHFREKLQRRTDAEAADARRLSAQKRFNMRVVNISSYLLVLVLVIFIYQRKIIKPIVELSSAIQGILRGKNGAAISYLDEQNEIGDLARSLAEYRKVTQAMDAQNWIESNTGKVVALIQQAESQSALAASLLSYISPLMDIGYAALYAYDSDKKQLCFVGGYGCELGKQDRCFDLGESLVGQCAQEKNCIALNDLPDDYIRIGTALGDAKPRHLCLLPIQLQDHVLGVLELASFRVFKAHERAFLAELMKTLAMTMEVLKRNLQTQKLLQETQEQALRMEKQAALLEEQTIELEAQQAELKETEAWYRSIIESAPQGMLVADRSGMIIVCNPKAEALFGYDKGELMGRNIDALVPAAVRAEYTFMREKLLSTDGEQDTNVAFSMAGARKDDSEFQLEANASVLCSQGCHDKCLFISFKEVTARGVY